MWRSGHAITKQKIVWQPRNWFERRRARGRQVRRTQNKQLAIVSHSDLPLATEFEHLINDQSAETLLSSVTLVPDRHEDGTNVMVVAHQL